MNFNTIYTVCPEKNGTLELPLVDHVGLAHIFYLHLLKTFRFIPVTLYSDPGLLYKLSTSISN